MKRIESACYQGLLERGTVLERDGYGEKVLALPDGMLVKVFRRKRWLSTALIYPYARRFVRNARRLAGLGISTVQVVDTVYYAAGARHLVTYRPLPGVTLRCLLRTGGPEQGDLMASFARFVATLHQKGVYFRSLHFGNVIALPDGGQLGLIDVADLSFHNGPLSVRKRERNFRHMLRYPEDLASLREYGWHNFLDQYLRDAQLSSRTTQRLITRICNVVEP